MQKPYGTLGFSKLNYFFREMFNFPRFFSLFISGNEQFNQMLSLWNNFPVCSLFNLCNPKWFTQTSLTFGVDAFRIYYFAFAWNSSIICLSVSS